MKQGDLLAGETGPVCCCWQEAAASAMAAVLWWMSHRDSAAQRGDIGCDITGIW